MLAGRQDSVKGVVVDGSKPALANSFTPNDRIENARFRLLTQSSLRF
jgi:hypothetical protein